MEPFFGYVLSLSGHTGTSSLRGIPLFEFNKSDTYAWNCRNSIHKA